MKVYVETLWRYAETTEHACLHYGNRIPTVVSRDVCGRSHNAHDVFTSLMYDTL